MMPKLLKTLPNEAVSSLITRNAKTIFKLDYSFFQNLQVSGTKNVLEIWLWNLANQLVLSVRLMATQDPVLVGNEKMIGHFQEQKLVRILEIFFLKIPIFSVKRACRMNKLSPFSPRLALQLLQKIRS